MVGLDGRSQALAYPAHNVSSAVPPFQKGDTEKRGRTRINPFLSACIRPLTGWKVDRLTGFFQPSNLPIRVLFKPMSAFWQDKRVIVTGGARDIVVPLIEDYDLIRLDDIRRLLRQSRISNLRF